MAALVVGHRMRIEQTSTVRWQLALLPTLFGFVGLVGSVAYQLQRYGAFLHSFYSLDRFIQHHLDATAGCSALAALIGILAGVTLGVRGPSRLVKFGTLFSVAVSLWCFFGLSL